MPVIRRQHGRKQVRRGKGHLGQRCLRPGLIQRQGIFQFVRQFAEFVVAAGRRVALQRVHDPPQAAHHLGIAQVALQLQRLVVQRLQQFLSAFKEQGAQFVHPLVGLRAHDFTSIRW